MRMHSKDQTPCITLVLTVGHYRFTDVNLSSAETQQFCSNYILHRQQSPDQNKKYDQIKHAILIVHVPYTQLKTDYKYVLEET